MKIITAHTQVTEFTTGVKNTQIRTTGVCEVEKTVELSTGYRGRGTQPLNYTIKAGTKVRYSAVENVKAKKIIVSIYVQNGGILYSKSVTVNKAR